MLIENTSQTNEAFYFIENIEMKAGFDTKALDIKPSHPRIGYLKLGEVNSFNIENDSL